MLNTFEAEHPEMEIRYARELGLDEKLLRAAGDRIRSALDAAGPEVPLHETMLVVVGRGASDPDANSNVAKVMRMLWEGFGFGWGETAYSGVTFPLVEPALEHAARLGYRRIVVFPYFLFTGVLVKRIYEHTDRVAARHPEIEFVKAPYLNDHDAVLDAFAERVEETLRGANLMNCKLCKYREQDPRLRGGEGAPPGEPPPPRGRDRHRLRGRAPGTATRTTPHHHDGHAHHHQAASHEAHRHGRGDHGHDPGARARAPRARSMPMTTGTGYGHGHGHGHHPYPHADHPLGPRTLKRSTE